MSAAQIEANRANALLSTGPKTEAGKRASSANATREGLTSTKIFVAPGQEERFEVFKLGLQAQYRPEGECETQLFDVILHAAWNVLRCIELENSLQNEALSQGLEDAIFDDTFARKLDRIYRYKKMHESTQRRATAELRTLQTEQQIRIENGIEAAPECAPPSPLIDFARVNRVTNKQLRLTENQARIERNQLIENYINPPFTRAMSPKEPPQ